MKRRPQLVNKIIPVLTLLGLLGAPAILLSQTNHIIQPGDTIDGISKQYGVSIDAIAQTNNLANPALIRPGQELIIPPSPDAPRTYAIKPGDTLGSIAIEFGTTISALVDVNNIEDPKKLQVGRTLQIPSSGTNAPTRLTPEQRHPLPADLKNILDATRIPSGRWQYIVIHHSGMPTGTLKGMDLYHRQKRRMENGLAYHFVIGNGKGIPDGQIEIGNRWKRQIKGGHLASESQNAVALGICLVGNYELHKPTTAQLKSLYALTAYLARRCDIPKSRIKTHTQINTRPTICPGKYFPTKALMDNL